jgi:hypothetical protein
MSCVTGSVLNVRGGYYPSVEPLAMILGGGDAIRLEGSNLAIRVAQHYRIVEDPGGASGPGDPGLPLASA